MNAAERAIFAVGVVAFIAAYALRCWQKYQERKGGNGR